MRRGRLILSGQYDPRISFVFITDQPNWGKNGDFSSTFIIQDALASFKVAPELTISAGFLLLPFLRNNLESAGSLNTVDFRTPSSGFFPPAARSATPASSYVASFANDQIGPAPTPGSTRYLALALDTFVEYPFDADNELIAEGAIIRYDQYAAGAVPDNAVAFYVQAGYRFNQLEPIASVEYFNGDLPGSGVTTFRVGLNY